MQSDERDEWAMIDPEVNQAEGVVSSQLGVPVDEAVMILRIRASARGLSLPGMAAEVLDNVYRRAQTRLRGTN